MFPIRVQTRGRHRGRNLRVAAAYLFLITAVGCGGTMPSSASQVSSTRTPNSSNKVITVGLLAPLSGAVAGLGKQLVNGWNLYWAENGTTVDGYTVKTISLDTAGNPTLAVTQARKLVRQDHVDMVVGPFLADAGLSVARYLEAHQVPFFFPASASGTLTQPQKDKYFIRLAGWTSSQPSHPAGIWACKTRGYETAVTLGPDYAYGWESIGGFADTYTLAGCRIMKQLWPPLGTTNFSAYIAEIKQLNPSVVYIEDVGVGAGDFLKQWSQFGMKGRIPIIAHDDLTGQADIAGLSLADVQGILSFRHYSAARQDPITQTFVQAYAEKYGILPAYVAAANYTAAQWVAMGIRKVNGNVTDRTAFLEAMRGISLKDSALGPLKIGPYGGPIENIYMTKVTATPAKYQKYSKAWNQVIETLPSVTQFGVVKPKTYMSKCHYSKTCQHLTQ